MLHGLASMGVVRLSAYTAIFVATAGLLDWLSPAEIASSLVYLLPISVAAWGSRKIGSRSQSGLM